MKCLDRFANGFDLVQYKVSGVVLVGFGVQIGAYVLRGRFSENVADGGIFHKPIAAMRHGPVVECARCPAVAVDKQVVITNHEVPQDDPYGRAHVPGARGGGQNSPVAVIRDINVIGASKAIRVF